jgi:hypothetical protein
MLLFLLANLIVFLYVVSYTLGICCPKLPWRRGAKKRVGRRRYLTMVAAVEYHLVELAT